MTLRSTRGLLAALPLLAVTASVPVTPALAAGDLDLAAPSATAASTPEASTATDQVIVRWAPELGPVGVADVLAAAGAPEVLAPLPLPDTSVLRVPVGRTAQELVTDLEDDPRVVWAEPDAWLQPSSADTGFPLLWGLENQGQVINGRPGAVDVDIQAPEAWAATRDAPGNPVVVAVVDSGVDIRHPDLAAAVFTDPDEVADNGLDDDGNGFVDDVSGWDFVNNDATVYDDPAVDAHGTHVAGTVGAVRDNGAGVAGTTERAVLLPVKFIGAEGGRTSDAVRAIDYAAEQGATVINASFGGPDPSNALDEAILASGAVVVAAAGNEGKNNDLNPDYPASSGAANVLSVAAVGNDGSLPNFSNRGLLSVDVGAPGVDVLSTVPGGAYSFYSGTSMAAPHASGIAGLVRSLRPDLTAGQVVELLQATVRPLDSLQGTTSTGGMVNALAAAQEATAGAQPAQQPEVVVPEPDPEPDSDSDSTETIAQGSACPDGIPSAGFDDVAGSVHRYAIDCVVWYGLARGSTDSTFQPVKALTRAQVATLLAGLIDLAGRLPGGAPDAFTDDEGDVHEENINKLASLGIIQGSTATEYEPGKVVSRAQMATLLVRVQEFLTGQELPPAPPRFVDILTSVHRENIEKAAAAGLVQGSTAVTFEPDKATQRAQAASFLARELQALVEAGVLEPRA